MTVLDLNTSHESASVAELSALLAVLIGQPLLFADFSYGDELSLHMGQPLPYTNQKVKGAKGSYIIGTRASNWHIVSTQWVVEADGNEVGSRLTREQFQALIATKKNFVIVGAFARMAGPLGFALFLQLEDGTTIAVVPNARTAIEDSAEEVADWEVFMPSRKYLKAGPGLQWSYLPSDKP